MPRIKKEPKEKVKAKAKAQVPASDLLNTLCSEIAGKKPSIRSPACGKPNHATFGPKLGVHGHNAGKWYVKCTSCNHTCFYGHELSESEREAIAKQEQDDIEGHPIRENAIKDFIKELKPVITNGVRKAEPGSRITFSLTGHIEHVDARGRTKRTPLENNNTSLSLANWREQSQTELSLSSTNDLKLSKRRGKRQLSPSPVWIWSPAGSNNDSNSFKRQRKLEQSPTISESAYASSSKYRGKSQQEVDIGLAQTSSSPIDLTWEELEGSETDDSIVVLS